MAKQYHLQYIKDICLKSENKTMLQFLAMYFCSILPLPPQHPRFPFQLEQVSFCLSYTLGVPPQLKILIPVLLNSWKDLSSS